MVLEADRTIVSGWSANRKQSQRWRLVTLECTKNGRNPTGRVNLLKSRLSRRFRRNQAQTMTFLVCVFIADW
jgi:hypothetical protein